MHYTNLPIYLRSYRLYRVISAKLKSYLNELSGFTIYGTILRRITSKKLLLSAVTQQRFFQARLLILIGADLNEQDTNGNTSVHQLIKLMANFTQSDYILRYGESAFFNTCAFLQDFLQRVPTNPNAQNKQGDTPLHLAAASGFLTSIVLLLSVKGIKVNLQNKLGKTPTDIAFQTLHMRAYSYLLEKKGTMKPLEEDEICSSTLFHNMFPHQSEMDSNFIETFQTQKLSELKQHIDHTPPSSSGHHAQKAIAYIEHLNFTHPRCNITLQTILALTWNAAQNTVDQKAHFTNCHAVIENLYEIQKALDIEGEHIKKNPEAEKQFAFAIFCKLVSTMQKINSESQSPTHNLDSAAPITSQYDRDKKIGVIKPKNAAKVITHRRTEP